MYFLLENIGLNLPNVVHLSGSVGTERSERSVCLLKPAVWHPHKLTTVDDCQFRRAILQRLLKSIN